MIVTLTGATGNMGREALKELVKLENVEKVRILVLWYRIIIKFHETFLFRLKNPKVP